MARVSDHEHPVGRPSVGSALGAIYVATAAATMILVWNNAQVESAIIASIGLLSVGIFESLSGESANEHFVLARIIAFLMCFALFAVPGWPLYRLAGAIIGRRAAVGGVLAWAVIFVFVLLYV